MSDPAALSRAGHLLDLGRHADAERVLRQLLAAEPDDVPALAMLSHALSGQDRDTEALAAAERWAAGSPDDDGAHRMRATSLSALDRHPEAVDAALEALRHDPDGWQNHLQYALSAARIERLMPDAAAAASRAVRLAPFSPDAHFVRGLVAHAQRRVPLALECAREALRLDPTHAGAQHLLTELEDGRLGWRRPLRGYQAALAASPSQAHTRERLGGLVLRGVLQVYGVALLGLLLLAGSSSTGGRVTIGVLVLLGAVALVAYPARTLDPGMRAFAGQRLRTDRHLQATVAVTLAVLVLTLLVAFATPPPALVRTALLVVGLGSVAVLVWGVLRATADD